MNVLACNHKSEGCAAERVCCTSDRVTYRISGADSIFFTINQNTGQVTTLLKGHPTWGAKFQLKGVYRRGHHKKDIIYIL